MSSTSLGPSPGLHLKREYCFFYFATVGESGEVEVWETPGRVLDLLTPIESVAEAALRALSFGYRWSGELETSAYRTVTRGIELVAVRPGLNCDNIQVLLVLTSEGEIFVVKQRAIGSLC